MNDNHKTTKITSSQLPTKFGIATVHVFRDNTDSTEHVALQFGDIHNNCLVRIHSECLTGEVLHSLKCDCGDQLQEAFKMISEETGILIYLRNHEGRGIGLGNKIKAYSLQDTGMNTIEANHHMGFPTDKRDFKISAYILNKLGISSIRLLTNNPLKMEVLKSEGIEIIERIATSCNPNKHNQSYLLTKATEMGHFFKGELFTCKR